MKVSDLLKDKNVELTIAKEKAERASLAKAESLTPIYQYLLGSESIGITGQVIEAEVFNLTNAL